MPSKIASLMILLAVSLVFLGCPSGGGGGGDEGQGEGATEGQGEGTGEAVGEGISEGVGEGEGESVEGEGEGEEEQVFFPDPNLRDAIHVALGIPVGQPIHPSDLANVASCK